MVSLLISNGADVNTTNEDDQSPLNIAAQSGIFSLVHFLINKGANISHNTMLFAVKSGNLEVVDFLISKGAEVKNFSDRDETPLSLAAEKGFVEIVELLAKHGCPVNHVTYEGTALQFALEKKNLKMIKILLQFEAHLSLKKMPNYIVKEVVQGGHLQIVDQLLATGLVPSNHFLQ
jgi:ankyrin repeat protein